MHRVGVSTLEQRIKPEVLYPRIVPEALPDFIHTVDELSKNYLQFRAIEREILGEPELVPHRENDAEHSWHVTDICDNIYQRRQELGIDFGPGFDPYKMLRFAHHHDAPERICGDVPAMSQDQDLLAGKALDEEGAIEHMKLDPITRVAALVAEEYDRKDTPEAGIVKDVDIDGPIVVIIEDGGRIWKRRFDGGQTTLEHMVSTQMNKVITPLGRAALQYRAAMLSGRPDLFPPVITPA